MIMCNELLSNFDKIHTTELGVLRIRRNLGLSAEVSDIVEWCKIRIKEADYANIVRRGKNWYVTLEDCVITVNAQSYTIITAHNNKDISIDEIAASINNRKKRNS